METFPQIMTFIFVLLAGFSLGMFIRDIMAKNSERRTIKAVADYWGQLFVEQQDANDLMITWLEKQTKFAECLKLDYKSNLPEPSEETRRAGDDLYWFLERYKTFQTKFLKGHLRGELGKKYTEAFRYHPDTEAMRTDLSFFRGEKDAKEVEPELIS